MIQVKKLVHGLTLDEWTKRLHQYIRISKQKVTVCRDCGAIKFKGKWIYNDVIGVLRDNYEYFVSKSINLREPITAIDKVKLLDISFTTNKIYLKVSINIGIDTTFIKQLELDIPLVMSWGLCPRCMARRGKVYKAILQVRSEEGREGLRSIVDKLLSALSEDVRNDIIEVKDVKDGVDLYVRDIGVARYIAKLMSREYGALLKESFKLISRKPDGHVNSRLTISLRLPSIKVGDFLRTSDGCLVIVEEVHGEKIRLMDVESGRRYTLPIKSYWNRELVKETLNYNIMTVIGFKKDEIIVMDKDYNTYNARNISHRKNIAVGDNVKVLIYKGKVYIID